MLESGKMPPKEATLFPTDEERAAAASWIRTSLKAYEDAGADGAVVFMMPAPEQEMLGELAQIAQKVLI